MTRKAAYRSEEMVPPLTNGQSCDFGGKDPELPSDPPQITPVATASQTKHEKPAAELGSPVDLGTSQLAPVVEI